MTSKYHTAMWTESRILDLLGAGEEIITHIVGLCSATKGISEAGTSCKFISDLQSRMTMEGHIIWNKPIRLQEIFDAIHLNIFPSFTIQEMTLIRKDSYVTLHNLPEQVEKIFKYKTFGFKPGTFKRWGATISPGQALYQLIRNRKDKLTSKIPKVVLRRVKDCMLMNSNEYTMEEIKKLFLDAPYIMRIEERDGIFHLNDFVDGA